MTIYDPGYGHSQNPLYWDYPYGAGKVQVFDALLRLLFNIEVDDTNPKVGDTIHMEASGTPGNLCAIPWLGTLEIAAPIHLIAVKNMPAGGHPNFPITIPAAWAGKSIYFQGVMDDRAGVTGEYLFSLVEEITVQP